MVRWGVEVTGGECGKSDVIGLSSKTGNVRAGNARLSLEVGSATFALKIHVCNVSFMCFFSFVGISALQVVTKADVAALTLNISIYMIYITTSDERGNICVSRL